MQHHIHPVPSRLWPCTQACNKKYQKSGRPGTAPPDVNISRQALSSSHKVSTPRCIFERHQVTQIQLRRSWDAMLVVGQHIVRCNPDDDGLASVLTHFDLFSDLSFETPCCIEQNLAVRSSS